MHVRNKKSITITVLLLTVFALSGFMPNAPEKPKNLKVLPKNISHEELDKVMDGFKLALGVKCNHCHAPKADDPKHLDFASDAKPEKEEAREMLRMTARINKKYFKDAKEENGEATLRVKCITCHNGQVHPR